MSMAQPASMSIVAELILKSVGVHEITIMVITVLVGVVFHGARLGRQTGASKSSESLKLKPTQAERYGVKTCSSKSTESPKLKPYRVGVQTCSSQSPEALKLKSSRVEQGGVDGAGCSSQPSRKRGQLHCPTPPQTLPPSLFLSKKVKLLIDCAWRRQDADAIAIFEDIKATVENNAFLEAIEFGKRRPVDVFDLLVQCAGRIGRTELVKVLFEDMTNAGIERPLAFYKSTMKLLASKKYYKEGMYVYSQLEADGLEPSPVMLSCLVSFAAELGDSDRATSFFDRLKACSIPSPRDYTAILVVFSKYQDWTKAIALVRDMQDRQAPIDSLVLNIVLSIGVAAGQVEAAKALLLEFSPTGIADVISYNTIMKGYSQQKDVRQAIKLLDEMCQMGVKPNAITFNTVMDAAVRSLQVIDAWHVLARMVEAGLSPDKVTCTILMKGLHCGATSEQLAVILDLMPSVTKEYDPTLCAKMFRSVIKAIAQVNDHDSAAVALSQMISRQVMLPPEEYQCLVDVLSFDKDGNRVEQSKQTMLELHDNWKCSPCAFVYHKNGCRLGPACPRCHMCSPEELSKAHDAKKAFMKARLGKSRKDFKHKKTLM